MAVKELNWNNPDPFDYRYIEHLYNMMNERNIIAGLSFSFQKPFKNMYTSLSAYNKLCQWITEVLNRKSFIDGDKKHYTFKEITSDVSAGFDYYYPLNFPKRIDFNDLSQWELEYNCLSKGNIADSLAEKLNQIHSILLKFRYGTLTAGYTVAKLSQYGKWSYDYEKSIRGLLSESINEVENNIKDNNYYYNEVLGPAGAYQYWCQYSSYQRKIYLGATCRDYSKNTGYQYENECAYYFAANKFITFFPEDFSPEFFIYAWSDCIDESVSNIIKYDSYYYLIPEQNSQYWAKPFGFSRGFNCIDMGRAKYNTEFELGKLWPETPPTPNIVKYDNYNNSSAPGENIGIGSAGSINYVAPVLDFGVDTGLKYM